MKEEKSINGDLMEFVKGVHINEPTLLRVEPIVNAILNDHGKEISKEVGASQVYSGNAETVVWPVKDEDEVIRDAVIGFNDLKKIEFQLMPLIENENASLEEIEEARDELLARYKDILDVEEDKERDIFKAFGYETKNGPTYRKNHIAVTNRRDKKRLFKKENNNVAIGL
ncbi:MAG: CPP1-like family protein [Clostridia bacterium]|jgi:hypothetical protein|nr:CPP1-like family protein [Clostridia bacterium]